MKALELIKQNKSFTEKASSFIETAKLHCQIAVLQTKKNEIFSLEDKITDKENILSVNTDLNKGIVETTRKDVKDTFEQLMYMRMNLDILKLEYKSLEESFEYYFKEEENGTK